MANYSTLKTAITDVIKQNGNNEITGALLQQSLLAMISSLGAGYQFISIAHPSTDPGTPDQNVFYFASDPGTYVNFSGIELLENEIAILAYNGTWSKMSMGAASIFSLLGVAQGQKKASVSLSINGNYVVGSIPIYDGEKYIFLLTSDSAASACQIQMVNLDGTITTAKFTINKNTPYEWTADGDYIGVYAGAQGVNVVTVTAKNSISDRINGTVEDINQLDQDVFELTEEITGKVDVGFDNILDKTQILDASGFGNSGNLIQNAGWAGIFGTIKLPWRNQQYITINNVYASGGFYCPQFDKNGAPISGALVTDVIGTHTFERADGAFYLGITFGANGYLYKPLRANYGQTLTEDQTPPNPVKKYLSGLESGKLKELFAYATGSADDTDIQFYGWKNGKCAIQRAIDSCDGETPTIIYCKGHLYVNDTSQFFVGENGLYSVVFLPSDKSNIHLIGDGPERTSIVVDLPDSLANYDIYQPMEIWGNNCSVKGMTITAKNARYCIHMDASARTVANNHKIEFLDLVLHHYENAGGAFESCFGLGISDGMELVVERCTFITDANDTPSLYLHDNKNFNAGYLWRIKDCVFVHAIGGAYLGMLQPLGSNVDGVIEYENNDACMDRPIFILENNNMASKAVAEFDANVFVRIKGFANYPIGFLTRNSTSRVLRITSKSTGANSAVRFNTGASAFDLLIRGKYRTGYTDKSGVVHINGYQYRDGVDVLRGYAMGELALDINRVASIQNRLGDCSVNNKILVVNVDGADYTVTFNQDYTNYSDADMLAVFTNVLGSVADVELYNWGADYFPELLPSMTKQKNTTQSAILCGMGVKITSSGISIAETDADVDGIVIEDVAPGYYGRVVRSAYLSMYESDHHHVCLSTYPRPDTTDIYQPAFNGNFGIGATPGVFEKKTGGILFVDYSGYVTIRK